MTARKRNDSTLARDLLGSSRGYSLFLKDPDSYRLGRDHFQTLARKMRTDIREVFRRVTKDGPEKHPSLRPVFKVLNTLPPRNRTNPIAACRALQGVKRR